MTRNKGIKHGAQEDIGAAVVVAANANQNAILPTVNRYSTRNTHNCIIVPS